nr:4-hydroxy-tetrahydrodipicolinate synthase [Bifidobacterium dolichotidis]
MTNVHVDENDSTASIHLLDEAPFGRVLPAMVTPMKSDFSIDYEAAQRVARQLVADGADGIVVNGTTGESPVTHIEEKVALVTAVKEAVDVPVISGAGSNDTAHTVRMVEKTQEAGADAVLVVCPYYSRPSQEGIFQHYASVNACVDKPMIVYDVPGRTGVRIAHETYCRLAELDHVTAVKDASGDISGAIRKRLDTGLTWYSGDDSLFLPFLSIGAVGIISVAAHAAAGPLHDLADAFDHGDVVKAQQLAGQIAPAIEAMNGAGFQAGMAKAALYARGIIDSTVMRLPNVGPTPEQIEQVAQGLRAAKLL